MTYMGRRRFLIASGTAAAGAWLASSPARAATVDIAKLAAGAKAEGEVTYYASTNPVLSQQLAGRFNTVYPGIKVNIVRLASGPLAQRYASELQAGNVNADIVQVDDPTLMADGFSKGWFANLEDLPSHQAWPAAFKESYKAVVSVFPETITYNTNLVKGADIPTGWQSVLNEKWRGRIIMADLRNSPSLMVWAALMYDTYGPDYLKHLASLKPRIVASTLPGTQLLAAGEAALLLPNLRMVSFSLIEKKAPLEDVTPSPSAGLEPTLAISAKAKHPNAARLLSNFILSRQGQEVLSKNVAVSPLPGIPGALPLPPAYHHTDIKEAQRRSPEILQLMNLE